MGCEAPLTWSSMLDIAILVKRACHPCSREARRRPLRGEGEPSGRGSHGACGGPCAGEGERGPDQVAGPGAGRPPARGRGPGETSRRHKLKSFV